MKSRLLCFFHAGLALTALNLLSGNFGTLDAELDRVFAFVAIAALGTVFCLRGDGLIDRRVLVLGTCIAAMWTVFLFAFPQRLVWVALFPLAPVSLDLIFRSLGAERRALSGIVIASLLYAVMFLLARCVPAVWHAAQWVSHSISVGLNQSLFGENIRMGPSVGGLWPWLSAIAYIIGQAMAGATRRRALAGAALATVIYLSFQVLVNRPWLVEQTGIGISRSQFLIVVPLAALIPLAAGWPSAPSQQVLAPRLKFAPAAILCAAILAISAALTASGEIVRAGGKKILVYDKGYLDWDVPEFDKYGPFSGGMFGLMPRYLALEGYELDKFDEPTIKPEHLQGHDVLMLVNLGKEEGKVWKQGEIDAIWEYVQRGGSLLVLGDHTNVFGLQECFNQLLDRVGIAFEFDSAYPCREGWQNCIELRPHPITAGLNDHQGLGIAIGASLTLRPPAYPIVVGRHSFSDEGYPENVMGSYLGNYSYEKGEPIGDLVLVAAANYGRGKVLVFGDTSSFQNGAWFSDFQPFTHNVFRWLASRSLGASTPSFALVVGIFLLASLVASGIAFRGTVLAQLVPPFFLSAGCVVGFAMLGVQMRTAPLKGDIALFDYSHVPYVSYDPYDYTHAGALLTNLDRNGFLSLKLDTFDREKIARAKVFVTIAPVKAFSNSEAGFLMRFMHDGGIVLAAAGHPHKAGLENLLRRVDLDVANVPLGPVPFARTKLTDRDPRFVDAYPIVLSPEAGRSDQSAAILKETEVLYRVEDFAVVVFRRVGRGGLVLIGDTRFLCSGNIESMEYGTKEGNILFLRSIFERISELQAMTR